MSHRIELRCPNRGRGKFAEVVDGSGRLEVACRSCKQATAHFDPPLLVIHTFDLATGVCIMTDEIEQKRPRNV